MIIPFRARALQNFDRFQRKTWFLHKCWFLACQNFCIIQFSKLSLFLELSTLIPYLFNCKFDSWFDFKFLNSWRLWLVLSKELFENFTVSEFSLAGGLKDLLSLPENFAKSPVPPSPLLLTSFKKMFLGEKMKRESILSIRTFLPATGFFRLIRE